MYNMGKRLRCKLTAELTADQKRRQGYLSGIYPVLRHRLSAEARGLAINRTRNQNDGRRVSDGEGHHHPIGNPSEETVNPHVGTNQ